MSTAPRVCLLFVLASFAFSASAQFQTPAIDGVINPGEYAHSGGNWSMTWDETYLYVARSNVSPSILHLDVDTLSSPTAGTNADGSRVSPGGEDVPGGSGLPSFPLPFRSDVRIFVKAGYASLATRDSSGGWSNADTAADPNDVMVAEGAGREVRIRWQALAGLTGRPAAFRWLGSALEPAVSVTSMTDPAPAANPGGTGAHQPYFFSVASTDDPTATDPFAVRESTWRVTSNQNSGDGTLRAAIDSANADVSSARRHVSFEVSQVSVTEALPVITATVTIDGHTYDGAGAPLRVQVSGPGTSLFDVSGLSTLDVSNAVFRNLAMDSFEIALGLTGGSGNLVAGCFFGSAGVSAMNVTGLALAGGTNATIGGLAAEDRNVFSTNTTAIALDETTGTQIVGNYIGPYLNGGALNGNTTGIDDSAGASVGLVISDNVISHNGSEGIRLHGSASITGNLIGVAPDGLTQMPNGTGILLSGASGTTIGSIADPNTIAFNSVGVDGTSGGGVVIRGNTFYENSTAAIDLSGTIEATPVIAGAKVEDLTIRFSLTPTASTASVRLDLYDSDPATPGVPQPKTLRASQCFNGDSFASVDWNVGSGYSTSDDLTLLATSYSDSGCVTPHTGTSNPSAIFSPGLKSNATIEATVSPALATRGQNVTLTATVSGGTAPSGTVSFNVGGFDDNPVSGCESVALTDGVAQCTTSFASDGDYSIFTTYNGDVNNAVAYALAKHVTVVAAIFTGPGSFSSSASWEGGVLPGSGDSFVILNSCTYDVGSALDYHTMYLGHGATTGSLVFGAGNPGLRVDHVVAVNSSVIDMTAGGTLQLDVSGLPSNITFVRGSGTVVLAGEFQLLPPYAVHNLTVLGTAGATSPAIVHGSLTIGAGASISTALGLEMHGPQITNQGMLMLGALQIAPGATTALTGNVVVQDMIVVDGTLVTSATSVLTADLLNGNGTVVVTGTEMPGSFAAQYSADTRDLTSLDVKFAGTAAQGVDAIAYTNLIIDNAAGATVAEGNASVSGMLTLAAGVLVTDDGFGVGGTLSLLTPSPTALVHGAGWIAGNGFGWQFAAGPNVYDFPVGTTTAHLPVTLTATLASPEMVRGGTISLANLADASGSGLDYARDSNAYYRFEIPAASSITVTINYGTHQDAAAEPELFTLRQRQGQWRATQTSVAVPVVTATFDVVGDVLFLAAGNQLLDRYLVSTAAKQYTGEWFDVTVTAVDKLNVRLTEADAPITMSSSSGNIRFDANGDGNFNDSQKALTEGAFTLRATTKVIETVYISATDGSLNGTSSAINVALGFAATQLTVTAPATVAGGTTFNATVTARRADGSVATGYTGTIAFSSIFEGTVPANYTYTPADAGSHTFTFQINRAGEHAISVREAVTLSTMSAFAIVKVTGTTSLVLTSTSNPTAAGQFAHFRAQVTSTITGDKTGAVTFRVDGVDAQTVMTTSNGAAFFSTRTLSFGTHEITAVYAGSQFFSGSTSNVLTHEVGASTFGPPLVTATALSTSSVEISWAPVAGAATFEVHRAASTTAGYLLIGSSATTSFLDTGRSANTTYLYKVRARAANGTVTGYSTLDTATTTIFTDALLNATVPVKAAHLTELRTAVNAMRAAANLPAFAFTALTPGATVSRVHVIELRTALNSARSTLTLPVITYTDPTITVKSTRIKAIHFMQLRNGAS
jgi:hypothetical protein